MSPRKNTLDGLKNRDRSRERHIMEYGYKSKFVTFNELHWDTDFFGISCAKAILKESLQKDEWDELKSQFSHYEFVSIENSYSNPINAKYIGMETKAFLADVNIQFRKALTAVDGMPSNVKMFQAMKYDNRILEISDFQFSKFINDPEFAKRNGADVYRQWLRNSFEKPGKFFAISENTQGKLNGYVLYSYNDKSCIIELIAVTDMVKRSGIGSSLFQAVESAAIDKGCNEIKVGTQLRNLQAINFYIKRGCVQTECHQIYHLWNC